MIDWDAIESRVLERLEPFQRRTVAWAHENLYRDGGTGRFLVADEVGLGKTMVAKGVLVKALRHLEGRVQRADVVYVCSNADIARQNLDRLRIEELGGDGFQSHGRLTLMPLIPLTAQGTATRETALQGSGINFLSLTPGTSLDIQRDVGQSLERALMCTMLQGELGVSDTQLRNLFTSRVSHPRFEGDLARVANKYTIDEALRASFIERVKAGPLGEGVRELSAASFRRRKRYDSTDESQGRAAALIGHLRSELASVCIDAVEPDLIILDEFQRFSKLLTSNDDDARLARQLFNHEQSGERARLLLLSATPYRMCSLGEDPADTQHYDEFLATVSFLLRGDTDACEAIRLDLAAYNSLLRGLDGSQRDAVATRRRALEQRLSRVIARTDRVPATEARDAMVSVPARPVAPTADDMVAYVSLKRVAEALGQPDLLEYWRSAAYPLSFLSGYALRDELKRRLQQRDDALLAALRRPGLFLPPVGAIAQDGGPANARARALAAELVGEGMHLVLWLPPSLPHYTMGGPYASLGEAARTKRLLFSSWRMVPRSVSTVVDEAFAHAIGLRTGTAPSNRHEGAAGDYALGYPCATLAALATPLALAATIAGSGGTPCFETVARAAATLIEPELAAVADEFGGADSTAPDHDWYWLGPLLLDARPRLTAGDPPADVAAWALDMSIVDKPDEQEVGTTTWPRQDHETRLQRCEDVLAKRARLGRMPADLLDTLGKLAVAGPAVCTLRALSGGAPANAGTEVRQAASSVAASLLHYFGHEQAVALLATLHPGAVFWRRVLDHCGEGCLQAVLDEYAAVLLFDRGSPVVDAKGALKLAWTMAPVLRLKPGLLRPEVLAEVDGEWQLQPQSRTLRHARPLLEDKVDGDGTDGPTPMTQLRAAFNSPFLPFVLSSTSIGQEGLDFHCYCHAIVHWNLPSNPVDFEQRDGRIHRYRNHAVRRNLAQDWGALALQSIDGTAAWQAMFAAAARQLRERGGDMGGLRPSWIYRCGDAGAAAPAPPWMRAAQGRAAAIERHVPAIPLSRDTERLEQLKIAVGCYRMVFAQPRQEDLLAHLTRSHGAAALAQWADDVAIDLRPPYR